MAKTVKPLIPAALKIPLILLLIFVGLTYLYLNFRPQQLKIAEVGTSLSPTFSDVPTTHPFFAPIEAVNSAGIATGCGGGNFCPDSPLTRAQAAVILMRLKKGASYTPPDVTSNFNDAKGHWAEDWIEALRTEGITGGCNGTTTNFCPDAGVTRAEFAIFLLRTKHGASYAPSSTSTTFSDTTSHWARFWIEDLKTQGITTGCGGGNFCPDNTVSRGEMATFVTRAFPTTFTVPSIPPSPIPSTTPSLPPSATPTPSTNPSGYNDVTTTHTFYTYIKQLTDAGIVGGCGGGNFCPDEPLSRAQAAVVLTRAKHGASYVPPTKSTATFSDVPTNHWSFIWVEQLKADGITYGCNGTTTSFCPDAGITRAEFAVMLLRAKYGASYAPPTASSASFTDVPTTYWAFKWIEKIKNENITTGCGGGNFCPESVVNRGSMTALVYNALISPNRTNDPTPSPSVSPSALPFPPGDLTENYRVDFNDFLKLLEGYGNLYNFSHFLKIVENYGTM